MKCREYGSIQGEEGIGKRGWGGGNRKERMGRREQEGEDGEEGTGRRRWGGENRKERMGRREQEGEDGEEGTGRRGWGGGKRKERMGKMGRGAGKERTKGKRTGVRTIVVNTRTSHPLHTATKLEVSLNEAGPAVSTVREVRTTSCCTLPFREQKRYIHDP